MATDQRLACRRGEIHLTALRLPRDASDPGTYELLLDDVELLRADRYRHPASRLDFVTSRGALRLLLGTTLAIDPRQVMLTTGAAGKPHLLAMPSATPAQLHFNVSHSGDVVLIAQAWDCPVGVDVEVRRALPDHLKVARRFFSPREAAELAALPAEELEAGFFRCWTRKEAYLKALGTGLAGGLERFSVNLAPGDAARVVEAEGSAAEAGDWQLHDLAILPEYAAALAYRGARRPLRRVPAIDALPAAELAASLTARLDGSERGPL